MQDTRMAMRRYYEQIAYRPKNAHARRSWWLARFAGLVCLIAASFLRFDLADTDATLKALVSGYIIAGLALIFSITALIQIWRDDHLGLGKAMAGGLLSLLILAIPAALQALSVMRSDMETISSDAVEQPPFSRSKKSFDARRGTIPATLSQEKLESIGRAYPDIGTLALDADAKAAFEMVRETARSQGWREVSNLAPGGRFGEGHIDFISRTPLLRLPIDITLRLRPIAGGTNVDIRCASRYPGYDYADNALVVRSFIDELSITATGEAP